MIGKSMRSVIALFVVSAMILSGMPGILSVASAESRTTDTPYESINVPTVSSAGRSLADTPWPMFHHDLNHTGRSQYDTSNNNGKLRWKFDTGGDVGTPAIGSDGTIYLPSSDHNLYALDPNGTMKWKYTSGDEIYSSPAIDSNGTIYFGSLDTYVYALNPNGTEKWSFKTGNNVFSSPAIGTDGTIYIGSDDGNLYALNPDGTKKWNCPDVGGLYSSPAVGPDGRIYFGSYDTNIYAVDPDGTKDWAFPTNSNSVSSPAIGPDGTIYIGSDDRSLYAISPTGSKKWEFSTFGYVSSSPAIGSNGTIYFGSNDGHLYALNSNGSLNWSYSAGSDVASSPVIGSEGVIYFGSFNNNLFALYPNGTMKWSFSATSPITSSPVIDSKGRIYIGSRDSFLYALGTTVATAPQNLTATEGNAQISLSWKAPLDNGGTSINNYLVYRAASSNCETFIAEAGKTLTFLDTGLTNGQRYFYKITARNDLGESPLSNEADTIPYAPPTAPQDLSAQISDGQVALNWSEPLDDGGTNITNYTLYRNGTIYKVLGVASEYNDTGLVNGITYTYNVSSTNLIGEGPRSVGVNATPMTIPTAPLYFSVGSSNGKVDLSWTAPASDGGGPILGYTVYRRTAGIEVPSTENHTIATNWADSNITLGTTYFYKVSATNDAGEGPASSEVDTLVYTVPGAPTLMAKGGTSMVKLVWTLPSDNGASIINLSIYRGTSPDAMTFLVACDVGSNTWADTNVTAGVMYYYTISAVNLAGEGPRSSAVNAEPYSAPGSPTLTATAGLSLVTLSWTDPISNGANIDSFRIYRGTSIGAEQLLVPDHVGSTNKVDTEVLAGTKYYYKVSAVNAGGEGSPSGVQNATPYSTPGSPTLTVSIHILKITLVWTEPSSKGATILGYNIYRGTTSGNLSMIVKGHTGGTTWIDPTVAQSAKYYYVVCAVNIAGEGPRSNEQSIAVGSVPGVPLGLKITRGDRQITVEWTAPTTGGTDTTYNVYRSETPSGTYTLIGTVNATKFIDTGSKDDRTYWYKVSAQNSYGASEQTAANSAKPIELNNQVSPMITGLVVVSIVAIIGTVAAVLFLKKGKKEEIKRMRKRKKNRSKK